ncbi:MAG: helix-turn-helix domain-containing protein [Streptococcaceae bacterium]|jgi:DNA-binding transcriptional regulator YiaG|nr:helix-turn-helix domain-containing protein [Streptococcaceae bacterium]
MGALTNELKTIKLAPFAEKGTTIQHMLRELRIDYIDFSKDLGIPTNEMERILAGLSENELIYGIIMKKLLPEYENHIKREQLETAKYLFKEAGYTFTEKFIIRQLRAYFDMTQQQFADLFLVSVQTVKNWENGRAIPNTSTSLLLTFLLNETLTPEEIAAVYEQTNIKEQSFG